MQVSHSFPIGVGDRVKIRSSDMIRRAAVTRSKASVGAVIETGIGDRVKTSFVPGMGRGARH